MSLCCLGNGLFNKEAFVLSCQSWTSNLGLPVKEPWHAWSVDDQVANTSLTNVHVYYIDLAGCWICH